MGILIGKTRDQYDNEYDKAIKDTKQAKADAAYEWRYNKALYDANKEYYDAMGVKDPGELYDDGSGWKTNSLLDTMNAYNTQINDLTKERADTWKKNKYNIYGDGLVGSLLNPFHQAGTAVQDFVSSGTSKWDSGERDALADLASIGEAGLTIAPFAGGALKAGKAALGLGKAGGEVAKATAKTLGKTMGKGALWGGTYGALGSLEDMGTKDFNLGQLLGGVALGAGMGAGMSGIGYGIGKAKNKLADVAMNNRAVWEDVPVQRYNDMGDAIAKNGVSYQDAFKTAGLDSPVDNHLMGRIMSGAEIDPADLTPEVMDRLTGKLNTFTEALGGQKAPKVAVLGNDIYSPRQQLQQALNRVKTIPNATETTRIATGFPGLAKNKLGQAVQGAGDLLKLGGNKVGVGNLTSRLLKTKTGKIGAGVGGGLLLGKLMNSGSGANNSNQLTNAELQELYNYIYRGGQ